MTEVNNYENHGNLQVTKEQNEQKELIDLKNNLETNDKTLNSLIERTGRLLTIDEAEQKQIIKNLGDDASDFLVEIKSVDNEFKELMLLKHKDVVNLQYNENKELFQLLLEFNDRHEPLFDKIDENDGNSIDELIEKTKFDKEIHEMSWDNIDGFFDSSKDGLSNGVLLGLKKYENLFDGGMDGIIKLAYNISKMVEEIGIQEFIKMIGESIGNSFKEILNFNQPTYKIFQSIGKFLVDLIIQLISGGIGVVGKIATVINKFIPEGIIKKGLNKSVKTGGEFLESFIGIKPELLSVDGIKKLGIVGAGKSIGNELMYYGGVTPYIIARDGAKLGLNTIDLIKKKGFTIDIVNPALFITPDGKTIVKLVKYNEKIELKGMENALRYLTGIKEKTIVPNVTELQKAVKIIGVEQKYSNRINNFFSEDNNDDLNNFSDSLLLNEIFSDFDNKYMKNNENFNADYLNKIVEATIISVHDAKVSSKTLNDFSSLLKGYIPDILEGIDIRKKFFNEIKDKFPEDNEYINNALGKGIYIDGTELDLEKALGYYY